MKKRKRLGSFRFFSADFEHTNLNRKGAQCYRVRRKVLDFTQGDKRR